MSPEKITRRDLLRIIVGFGVLLGVPIAAEITNDDDCPEVPTEDSGFVSQQAQRITELMRPILLLYLQMTSRTSTEVDADSLVELWDIADEAANKFPKLMINPQLEMALEQLCGRDAWRQACARRFPGYEL